MKINTVEYYKFNNIKFSGGKNNKIQESAHSSNMIKSIPVAVLIAMSPLNAPLQAQNSLVQTTSVNYIEDELHGYHYDKGKTSDGTHCKLTVYEAEDNKKSAEISLTKKLSSYALDKDNNIVDAFRIKEVIMTPTDVYKTTELVDNIDGYKDIKTKYYAVGSGTEYISVPLSTNPNIALNEDAEPMENDFDSARYEISADLYKSLKKLLKN